MSGSYCLYTNSEIIMAGHAFKKQNKNHMNEKHELGNYHYIGMI